MLGRLQDGVKGIINTFIAEYNFSKYFAIFIITMPKYIIIAFFFISLILENPVLIPLYL